MTETFQIKMDGLKAGAVEDQVIYQLVILFKRSRDDIQRMLDRKGYVVKKGVDLPTAIKYKFALEQRGCLCVIEPLQNLEPVPAQSSDDTKTKPAEFNFDSHDLPPEPPLMTPTRTAPAVADDKSKPTVNAPPAIANELGTTVHGDPFIVHSPQSFCCNCGEQSRVKTIGTDFVKHLLFSTRFEDEKVITLALPYCPVCAQSVGKYPMSSGLKGLLVFCVWFAAFFTLALKNVGNHSVLIRLMIFVLPFIPAAGLNFWMGRPKAPQTSKYTPVIIKEYSRNPNSVRNEGRAMLIISAIAAGLGAIFKRVSQHDPDQIKRFTMKFSNPAYAKAFKKCNKNFIKEGLIKII
ncbi:hypothetical protein AAKU67_002026 [Oxalobacteraceae bacterium GrIS 2.11]